KTLTAPVIGISRCSDCTCSKAIIKPRTQLGFCQDADLRPLKFAVSIVRKERRPLDTVSGTDRVVRLWIDIQRTKGNLVLVIGFDSTNDRFHLVIGPVPRSPEVDEHNAM